MSDEFKFCMPLDIVKGGNDTDGTEWRIGGYASTSQEDRQGDEIIQKGLDYSDFVDYGWFNFDHNNEKVIGYPDKDKVRVDSKGFYVEGTLLKGVETAKSVWETAMALKKSNSPRRLGFSVEGKILKKDAIGRIIKAKVYNVAVTPNPVNTNCTWEALVKSFTTDIDAVNKAMEAGQGDNPVIPESLESAFKTLSYAVGDDKEAEQHMLTLKKRLLEKQDIKKSEFMLYCQLCKGMSRTQALHVTNKIFAQEG